MTNVALNKVTTSSSYIKPFSSSRAVDGNVTALSRWLSNVPTSMMVDLGEVYWIGRWVCYQMGSVGWDQRYNNTNFKFYGSLDGAQWTELDSVTGNTSSMTDRTITVTQCRFVRLNIIGGLSINPKIASVVELAVYDAPAPVSSSKLESLTISSGELDPSFDTDILSYNVSVTDAVSSIIVTPTSIDGGTIKVSGLDVESGTASQAINLGIGSNAIEIVVTSRIGGVETTYTVNVNRVLNLNLSSLGLVYSGKGYSETHTITMEQGVTSYADNIGAKAATIKITPFAEDSAVSISVGGQIVSSGQEAPAITLQSGVSDIVIIVSKTGFTQTKTYHLSVTKG
ncbi:cadherin-like beta sandwich domain-containing protein [Bacteroides sp.]|uniref:cadherin-like beta sandwich domain-containing protein n=1 Tax=Bacteroides sp. TaxID=29523 RepID=UPI0026318AFF|nr:cadherin-like beta sandwich domain-containing protein [Bacteroides sp.]MDD3040981.1 cadherin-like beta sandwich domain-containing protein [Bacteroides sp.]